jgi:hypothetical protein
MENPIEGKKGYKTALPIINIGNQYYFQGDLMFGKKKESPVPKLPAADDSRQIKQNIGNVSSSGMMDVGASMNPPPPPPPAPAAPRPPVPKRSPYAPPPEEDIRAAGSAMELPAIASKVASGGHGVRQSPPLFIKIDKYRELVKHIKDLRSNALNLRDALDAITDIEKELRNGIAITQGSLDRFNSIITSLDSRLLKVGAEEDIIEVPRDMDNYVKDLYDHVERIKHDLKTIKEQD